MNFNYKNDLFVNNINEVFNRYILELRSTQLNPDRWSKIQVGGQI